LTKQQILDHLGEPYISIKDVDLKIWFSGIIDRKSGHVTSAKPGRLGELQIDRDSRGES
jgi:hypothetical protein